MSQQLRGSAAGRRIRSRTWQRSATKRTRGARIINRIAVAVEVIVKTFAAISEAVKKIKADAEKVLHWFQEPPDPSAETGRLVDRAKQHTLNFEQLEGWHPDLGVGRLALLPPP